MPVWLSFFLLILFSQPLGFGTFLDNGQFAIYAAAALSPIFYLLSKQGSGQERALYQFLIVICLIFSATIFSVLTVADSTPLGDLHINVVVLRIASIAIYVFALVATFFMELHEAVYSEVNFGKEQLSRQDQLEEEFDRTLKSMDQDDI